MRKKIFVLIGTTDFIDEYGMQFESNEIDLFQSYEEAFRYGCSLCNQNEKNGFDPHDFLIYEKEISW